MFFSNKIIQVAGVRNAAEAKMLIACGVKFLGFPLRLDVHSQDLSEAAAAKIIRNLPDGVTAVLITYLKTAREIAELSGKLGTAAVQIHGQIAPSEITELRKNTYDLQIIKSLVVHGDNFPELERMLKEFSPMVDAFITDTYDPQTGASGATGKTHDWEISRRLVKLSPKPVILAGGLNPGNIREAILKVKPAGVDVHTGVENQTGRKDPELVRRFISRAQSGFRVWRRRPAAE